MSNARTIHDDGNLAVATETEPEAVISFRSILSLRAAQPVEEALEPGSGTYARLPLEADERHDETHGEAHDEGGAEPEIDVDALLAESDRAVTLSMRLFAEQVAYWDAVDAANGSTPPEESEEEPFPLVRRRTNEIPPRRPSWRDRVAEVSGSVRRMFAANR